MRVRIDYLGSALSRLPEAVNVVIEYYKPITKLLVDDYGRIIRENEFVKVRGPLSPIGNSDKQFLPQADYDIDDNILKIKDDGKPYRAIKVVIDDVIHSVVSQLQHRGVRWLIMRRTESLSSEILKRLPITDYRINHKRMIERLDVPIISDGETTEGLALPYIVYVEDEAYLDSRRAAIGNSKYLVKPKVSYFIYQRKGDSNIINRKFESLINDTTFWGSWNVSTNDLVRERELDGGERKEYFEVYSYVLQYSYYEDKIKVIDDGVIKEANLDIGVKG